jgi:hypothetical protein
VDLASSAMGGRVEWVSSQYPNSGVGMNVIAATSYPGWYTTKDGPHEIVFSFFSHQSALVGGVEINPMTRDHQNRPKDVEIWTSTQSAAEGFVKAAAATLKKEDALQPISFDPVEAKFVKIRILTWYGIEGDAPSSGFGVGTRRVRVLEGQRAGYTTILQRNPELAAIRKGVVPVAPPAAALPPLPAQGPDTCAAAAPQVPKNSNFPQSRQVLIVTGDPVDYSVFSWSPYNDKRFQVPVLEGVTFSWVTPEVAEPAYLISEPKVDTVVFAQVCEVHDHMSAAFKQALIAWVAAGHKLIIQDSDYCAGGRTPRYDFLPYTFATVNPGATGSGGLTGILENSTLASASRRDAAFIDAEAWKAGPNDLGDSNVVVKNDPRWCGAMWARNVAHKSGFSLAYTHYGRGLIIYDGFDRDQIANREYQRLNVSELKQPFDPDYLACSLPAADFFITSRPELRTQPMTPGETYTYPLSVMGNFGYQGKVTLDAKVVPADPTINVKLDRTDADLTKEDESKASLTVTTAATTAVASKVIAVRGKDATGKSNVLCLALPERRTGGLTVLSGLRADKKPTKNLEIILDASGSMKLPLGKKTRWTTALDVLNDVVGKLPADYSVGLRTYGHRESSLSPKTCKDTELVAPVAPLDRARLMSVARALRPRGETPLVYSILQTPGDLKGVGGGSVILITDGEESCKGDIAAAAKTLTDSGVNLSLNIVGFTLKNALAQKALGGLAESMGGHYYSADTGAALGRALLLAAVDQLPYRILDGKGAEVDKGVAGVDGKHELPPGDYTIVVSAGDESLKVPVTLALRQDVAVTVGIKDDKLVVEK